MLSRLTVDLDALAHNFGALKAAAGGAEIAPVIKADGYGLGAGPIARRLHAEGASTFFIARLEEGEALRRELGERRADILVLDGALRGSEDRIRAAALTPVLTGTDQTTAWKDHPLVLHVDTGMNRAGVTMDEARALARKGYSPDLVMSHLGSAADETDPRNGRQLERFREIRALFPKARASLAASSGVFLGEAYRFDMVRPGISLFGGGPKEVPDQRFQAVATLTAPVLQVRDLAAGEQAGYGSAFTAPRDMKIAVVACGYADGVLRGARGRANAVLHGKAAPMVYITMDLIGLDVTEILAARAGDEAELLGPHALLDDLANAIGTAAHECLVRLGGRSERIYLNSGTRT